MATILESTAAFSARATEHGLTPVQLQRLQQQGITSLSQLAFALTTPGTSPGDEALKTLLHDDPDQVTVGQLSSIRRLMFDAQTLSAAQVKHVLSGSEAAKKAELVPAERAQRIQDQKEKLSGMELTGPYECSHASYDYVAKMIENNAPSYLEPHRFTTRSSEVSREKPGKELVLDQTHLTVKDVENRDKCPMQNELQIFQALTRRALACDLMGVATFKSMEKWHRFLMDSMTMSPPPGYKSPTIEQALRADRAGWVRMAEKVDSLRRLPDGRLPLDAALDDLRSDPATVFHMLPLPMAKTMDKPTKPAPATRKDTANKNSDGSSKGKGKGKKRGKNRGKMPVELVGLNQTMKSGKRICYNYNLAKGCQFAQPGGDCNKGCHVCMRCFGQHPAHQCTTTTS